MPKTYDIVEKIGNDQFTYQLYNNIKPTIEDNSNLVVSIRTCQNCPPYPVAPPNSPVIVLSLQNKVNNSPPCSAGANYTFDSVLTIDGVIVNSVSGSVVNTEGLSSLDCNGFPTRDYNNFPNLSSSSSGIPKPNQYALYTEHPTYEQSPPPAPYSYSLLAWNDFWTTPFDGDIAAAQSQYDIAYAQWEADKAQWEIDNQCC